MKSCLSRRLIEVRNACFWRRDLFSSPFWAGKLTFLTTRLILVTILSWETYFFDDETYSRHHFEVRNALFWRRDLFSSPFWGEKCPFLTTRLILLVTFLRRKTYFFDEETYFRHHFEVRNVLFWRRDLFSSPFWGGILIFWATRLNLSATNSALK
jgi:hypothetical protein